jgi:transposase
MNEVESIRLEQFRQLKKDIRGSNDYLIVGIDVAKDKHNAFLAQPQERHCLKD